MDIDVSDMKDLGMTEEVETHIRREMGNLRIEDVPTVLLNVDHEELSFIMELRQLGEEYDTTALVGVERCHKCKSHDDIAWRSNGKVSRPMCGTCFMAQEGDRLRNHRAPSIDDQLYYIRKQDLHLELAYTQGGKPGYIDYAQYIKDDVTPGNSGGYYRNPGINRKRVLGRWCGYYMKMFRDPSKISIIGNTRNKWGKRKKVTFYKNKTVLHVESIK